MDYFIAMKRKEIFLILIIFIIAIVLGVAIFVFSRGNRVVVTLDGNVYGEYDLNHNQEIEIKSENGINILKIKDKKAFVTMASCPDKICQNTYPISEEIPGVIVCLPNKVVITLKNNY